MKLQNVRVENYKSIYDSTTFRMDEVTCLVGKNEAGKTAILEALTKLRPVSGSATFDSLQEFPRNKLADAEKADTLKTANVLTTEWTLETDDRAAVAEELGVDPFTSSTFQLSKGYRGDGKMTYWSLPIDEKKLVKSALSGGGLSDEERAALAKVDGIETLISTLTSKAEKSAGETQFLAQLTQTYKDQKAWHAVSDVLERRMPKFAYFSTYDLMPGQVSIDQLLTHKQQNAITRPEEVFIALLEQAGTTPEDLQKLTTFEALRARLEAVSASISEDVFAYWSQNRQLRVLFTFEEGLQGDPAPFNTGKVFRTRIFNPRHQMSLGFDDRSAGFVWFFSFLAWFSQVRKHLGKNLILLLDEPGLSLHAKAQGDLLRYINEQLRPNFQVIYTTHSPFMVDTENFGGIRLVEDIYKPRIEMNGRVIQEEQDLGTKVGAGVLASNPDTLFPLQAALGLDITQSLFVGKHNLLVEGPSDILYLKWFSRELQSANRNGLDPRWVLAPVGGVEKMGSFAALFGGNRLDVCALVDVHDGQKKIIEELEKHPGLRPGHVLRIPKYLGRNVGDIEDMLGTGGYQWLVNRAYGLGGTNLVKIAGSPERILESVKDAFRVMPVDIPEFDHFTPADYLSEHSDEVRKEIPGLPEALNRFEALFADCNALLEVASAVGPAASAPRSKKSN